MCCVPACAEEACIRRVKASCDCRCPRAWSTARRGGSGLPPTRRSRPSGRKLTIARREDLLQAGRTALQDADTEEHLRRTRPRIERLIGVLANRYGARKNRYIGSAKARLQASWAATLVNLNPISHRLATQTA